MLKQKYYELLDKLDKEENPKKFLEIVKELEGMTEQILMDTKSNEIIEDVNNKHPEIDRIIDCMVDNLKAVEGYLDYDNMSDFIRKHINKNAKTEDIKKVCELGSKKHLAEYKKFSKQMSEIIDKYCAE